MKHTQYIIAALAAAVLAGCASLSKTGVTKERFGAMPDGRPVSIFTLKNGRGAEAASLNTGASSCR